ncbi:hypothetical protein ROZALSC1DRAFT_30809 [Rozella allomycis CSF55]|uniref:TNFR-Cys domain-containing protein n=1 Tax=Rozella allomycis (strain CSF55) TaxID=988480 RepID=A0A4V1IZA5_ROZAC|nr:hypothetical protein ROZALSC1DRAFT_30809 [Rozella allomycis CSF55]
MFRKSIVLVSMLASTLLAFPTAIPDDPQAPPNCLDVDCKTCAENFASRVLMSTNKSICIQDSQDGCKDASCSDCEDGFARVARTGFWGCQKIDTSGCTDSKCETCKQGFLKYPEPTQPCKRRLDFAIIVKVGNYCLAQDGSYIAPADCYSTTALKFYDNADSMLHLDSKESKECLGSKRAFLGKLWVGLVDCSDSDAYKYVPKEQKLVDEGSTSFEVDLHPGNDVNFLDWDGGNLHVATSDKTVLPVLLNFY